MPASTNGCSGNDIDATLDDEAATPVETQCAGSVPTILGTFTPNNPLSAFDGQSLAGTWRLTASDNVGTDVGTLTEWCLAPTATFPRGLQRRLRVGQHQRLVGGVHPCCPEDATPVEVSEAAP